MNNRDNSVTPARISSIRQGFYTFKNALNNQINIYEITNKLHQYLQVILLYLIEKTLRGTINHFSTRKARFCSQ